MYMLPSDMNLNIRSGTAVYSNKIFVSDSGFSLERNDMVNTSAPESHKAFIICTASQRLPTKKLCQNTPEPVKCTKTKGLLWYLF